MVMMAAVPKGMCWRDLGLSRWTRFWLRFSGFIGIGDLLATTRTQLLHETPGIGPKDLAEIEAALERHGLWLYPE